MRAEKRRELLRHVVGVRERRARPRREEDARRPVCAQARSKAAQRLANDAPRAIPPRRDPDAPIRDDAESI